MELWVGAINLGLLYAFMAVGVFITYRIHNFPDITVDGSFTAGAATAAILILHGVNPPAACIAGFCTGAVAGIMTAVIHVRLNIGGMLAGILVMTALYSINLHIMGRSNIPLLNTETVVSILQKANPGMHQEIWLCLALSVLITAFWLGASLFFKTDLGIAMRTTGSNPVMAAAAGVNVDRMKIFGVALSNGLVGLSGALVAQYQGFADIGMGIGTVVIGLATVIIGESILHSRSVMIKILSVILGSLVFRLMIAVALTVGMNPIDLKLLTAVFVLATLIFSKVMAGQRPGAFPGMVRDLVRTRPFSTALTGGLVLLAAVLLLLSRQTEPAAPAGRSTPVKIGVVQLTEHPMLNNTRDGFVSEMKKLGYTDEKLCRISLENANGDMPTVNTILDNFLLKNMDVIVPISTACAQPALTKIKDRPVVFATVADPFKIGAGKSETDHLPNVTGIYGLAPMDKLIDVFRRIMPGPRVLGAMWDPAQVNSVVNIEALKKVASAFDTLRFEETTVTTSAEVFQAASSLATRKIDAFVLSTDHTVFSAFESVVKAAASRRIPIFITDVERLADGALCALGYDYTSSGVQAAHLVDRILKGEKPSNIPFERYTKMTFGLNLDVARELGISIPDDVRSEVTLVHESKTTKPAGAGVKNQ